MSEGADYELLADLAKLLKKHGANAFRRLAGELANPQFAGQLSDILNRVAAADEGRGTRPRAGKSSLQRVRARLALLAESDPERGGLLLRLFDGLLARTDLSAKDLRSYADQFGLARLPAGDRLRVIESLITVLEEVPLPDLQRHSDALLCSDAGRDTRHLAGWAQIILGQDRPRKTGA